MRIVSLSPAITELLHAAGLAESLVGCTAACPPGAPVLRLGDHVDLPALCAARPDLVLTGLDDDPRHTLAADTLRAALQPSTQLSSFAPTTLDGVLQAWQHIGELTEKSTETTRIVGNLRIGVDKVTQLWATSSHNPTAVAVEMAATPVLAGRWVPELIQAAGGQPQLVDAAGVADGISWDDVVQVQPEMLLCMQCGSDVNAAVAAFVAQIQNDIWRELPATYLNQIICVDARLLMRPGLQLLAGVQMLAGLLHPNRVPPPEAAQAVRVQPFPLDRLVF
jgi:iron complex transport system substrate-binding protein